MIPQRHIAVALIVVGSATGAIGREPSPTLSLPVRPADSVSGSQFAKQIESLAPAEREAAILREVQRGNIPNFLRTLKAVPVQATGPAGMIHRGAYFVMPDYLSVGSDDNFFRQPMRPQTAQAIADACDASLMTAKMSDDVFTQAELKLPPRPLTKDRDAAATFYQHHQIIEEQRAGAKLGLLVTGIKKDVVLTNRLREREGRVAIYGWHYLEGKPIQPLYVGHSDWHVDYSHGSRLVSRRMVVDDRPMDFLDVLKDPELCGLVSNEGPVKAGYKQ